MYIYENEFCEFYVDPVKYMYVLVIHVWLLCYQGEYVVRNYFLGRRGGGEVRLFCFVFLFLYGCVLFIVLLKEVYGVNLYFWIGTWM